MGMNVPQRASSASTLVLGGLAANLGLTLLSLVISKLVPGSYEGPWPMIEGLLWLGAAGTLAVGLFQLSSVVTHGLMLQAAAVTLLVQAVLDLVATLAREELGGLVMYDAMLVFFLVTRGLLIVGLVQATLKTHA